MDVILGISHSIVVSIRACHAWDLGSTPSAGVFFIFNKIYKQNNKLPDYTLKNVEVTSKLIIIL